ncbi:DUF86 domain-containing protein [Candidatus Dojkabacteria bacterium]|nr:DUF86 domain-containing protein [Candidatus Dojkabacteria bacterium]
MKKTVKHYLADIKEYAELIILDTKNLSEEQFSAYRILQDAVLRRIGVIGEVVKRIPDSYRAKYKEIPWEDMAGTGDVIVHDYDGVDMSIVWEIVSKFIPEILPQIDKLLESEDFEIHEE